MSDVHSEFRTQFSAKRASSDAVGSHGQNSSACLTHSHQGLN
jgi:hypothetical protein